MSYNFGDLVYVNEAFDVIVEAHNNYSITKFNNKVSNSRIAPVEDVKTIEESIANIVMDENYNDGFLLEKVLDNYVRMGGSDTESKQFMENYKEMRRVDLNMSNINEALDMIESNYILLDKTKLGERKVEIVTENSFFMESQTVPVKVFHNDKLMNIGTASRVVGDIVMNESNESVLRYTWDVKKPYMSKFNMKTQEDVSLLSDYIEEGHSFTDDGIFTEYDILKSINEGLLASLRSHKLHSFDYKKYEKKVKKYHKGKIYVLGFASDSTFGKVTRLVTGKNITHTSISLDPEFRTILTFRFVTDETKLGLATEDVLIDYNSSNSYVAHELSVDELQLDKFMKKLKDIKKSGYDYALGGAIKSIALSGKPENVDVDGAYRMFCSQFVDMMLKEVGYDITKVNSSGVDPGSLDAALRKNNIKIYDEGNLYNSYFKARFNVDISKKLERTYKKFKFQLTKLRKNFDLKADEFRYKILPIVEDSSLYTEDELLTEDKHNPYKKNASNANLYYHAGKNQDIKELKVNYAKTSHNKNFVPKIYASSDVGFAAGFSFDWEKADIKLYRKKDSSWIIEIPKEVEPNLAKPASMYFVEPATFKKAYGVTTPEVVSEKDVKIVKEIKYKTARECLVQNGVDIKIV